MTEKKEPATTTVMNKDELMAEVYARQSGLHPETCLEVIKGPDKGKRFLIAGPTTYVGRSSEMHCTLADPRVSAKHFSVRYLEDKNRFFLVDEGSTNGTIVNGKPFREGLVRNGDQILVGDTVIRFKVPQPPAENV